jgi:hypothetical protein
VKGTIAIGYRISNYQTPSYCRSKITVISMITKIGMYVLTMSAIRFDIQYAGRLTPDMTCMCFNCYSRSLIMNEMITQGIKAKAIDVMMAKSIACPESTRDEKTKKIGKGAVCV